MAEKGQVERKQLDRYIQLEKKIVEMEKEGKLRQYEEITRQIEDVSQTIQALEIDISQKEMQTQKEKKDVDKMKAPSIREMFKSQEAFDKKLSEEEEEYLAAKNSEEVLKKNLEGLKKQKKDYEEKAAESQGPAKELKSLYEERDNLLSDIFNGEYGSDLENQLEAQFDDLMDRKQRVSVAHYKWTNARVLLQHAVNQLCLAVRKWKEVPGCQNQQLAYTVCTEVRNNLVAAVQNVNSTQRYLHTIAFPYCEPKEMETLGRAINHIYLDATAPERHSHALNCYDVTYKRANALLQWFDNVINQTIQKDLKEATHSAKEIETKLRAERLRLIRDKVKESGGSVDDLNEAGFMGQTDETQIQGKDEDGLGVVKPECVDGKNSPDAKMAQMQVDDREPPPPTPIPLSRLAPPPSQDEIFGNIDKLKTEHERNKEEYLKKQEFNKARLEQNLQSKLEARRHKKKL